MEKATDLVIGHEGEEMNPIVLRLLTTEEIDYVSGGHTVHSMGFGSSYSQAANTHFAQGAFSSYTMGGRGFAEAETISPE